MKARPNSGVLAWLAEVDEDTLFISVVTITELRYGTRRLATGKGPTRQLATLNSKWWRKADPVTINGEIASWNQAEQIRRVIQTVPSVVEAHADQLAVVARI